MNKTLKFKPHFIETILKKDQLITARLFDDKNLSVGDTVDLLDSESNAKFASAQITRIRETTFADMVKHSHNVNGMYDLYKSYYRKDIKPEDMVKWIYLQLLDIPGPARNS